MPVHDSVGKISQWEESKIPLFCVGLVLSLCYPQLAKLSMGQLEKESLSWDPESSASGPSRQ